MNENTTDNITTYNWLNLIIDVISFALVCAILKHSKQK